MPDEEPLKSAYELAMDRLRAKDEQEGLEPKTPLTQAQKDEIARLRQESTAKMAELEILHRKEVASATDPAKLQAIEEKFRIDRGRVESRLESALAKVRRGGGSTG